MDESYYIKGSRLNRIFYDKIMGCQIDEDVIKLGTSLADLEESFKKILGPIFDDLEKTDTNNYDKLLESFTELWSELRHIEYHINQANEGLLRITNELGDK